jgi:hypothetical protein
MSGSTPEESHVERLRRLIEEQYEGQPYGLRGDIGGFDDPKGLAGSNPAASARDRTRSDYSRTVLI